MSVEVKGIVKSFQGVKALSGVSFFLDGGKTLAITGRSGAGKTTLLHIIGGLEKKDSGEVFIEGRVLERKNASMFRREKLGFIFQNYNLLEDFSVLDNVLFPARIAKKNLSKSHGETLLEKVGLLDKAKLLPKQLSGGERQRVAIARALCNDPGVILADEPTGNLDRENAKKIAELLLQSGKTVILVTHDPVIGSLCEEKLHIEDGIFVP